MILLEDLGLLFDNRDVVGNEPDEPDSSDSDDELGSPLLNVNTEGVDDGEVDEEAEDEAEEEMPSDDDSSATILCQKVNYILNQMDEINLKSAEFLDALSWGNATCTRDPKIRIERTMLLHDPKLEGILNCWAFPPRLPGLKKARARGANATMKKFTIDFIKKCASLELEKLAPFLLSPAEDSEDVQTQNLIATDFKQLSKTMQNETPLLWNVLDSLTQRPDMRKPISKDTKKVC